MQWFQTEVGFSLLIMAVSSSLALQEDAISESKLKKIRLHFSCWLFSKREIAGAALELGLISSIRWELTALTNGAAELSFPFSQILANTRTPVNRCQQKQP